MASIMTNTSAMTALQTLRRVTGDLETTQDRISTGLKVNNAKDNAAYWSIATTMKADVAGFKAVKESLELGSGTTNTASVASKNIVENLQTLKARVIAGQTNGVDKSLIQNDVDQLVKLIKGAAADASFNGDNLLRVSYSNDGTAKDKDVSILASLSRSDSTVDPSYIEFQRQDMRVESIVGKATIEQQINSVKDVKASVGFNVGEAGETFIDGQNLGLGEVSFSFTTEKVITTTNVNGPNVEIAPTNVSVKVDLSNIVFDTDRANTEKRIADRINYAIADAVYKAIDAKLTASITDATDLAAAKTAILGVAPVENDAGQTDTVLASQTTPAYAAATIDAKTTALGPTVSFGDGTNVGTGTGADATVGKVGTMYMTVGAGYTDTASFTSQVSNLWVTSKESDAFGGLADLTQIDVVNNSSKSLEVINSLLDKAIAKSTVIGSIESRVSVQNDFVSKLTDAMNKGIGALVDADMNEESSRLQALQVQQQLAIQALSIANQGPQNILSLFR
ncbi:flagellin [Azospirillum endophyticum]|uniref:flagellin N-terminal helical domain-containing protein n=1 Tax=Azospirillum endophyticum TaxID=2800326 RepID=UPI0020000935|nr:flagellin [Azospirillum endophyticum]